MLAAEAHGINDSSSVFSSVSADEEDTRMHSRAASQSPPATSHLQESQEELPPEGQLEFLH